MFILNLNLSASPNSFKLMDSPASHQKTVTLSEPVQSFQVFVRSHNSLLIHAFDQTLEHTSSTPPVADVSTSLNAAPDPPPEDASLSGEKRTRKRKRHSKKRPQLYFPEPIPPQLMDPPSSRYHFGAYVSKARIIEFYAEYCGERNPELKEGEPGWNELSFFQQVLEDVWGGQAFLGLFDVELWHEAHYKDISSACHKDGSVYVGAVRIEDGKGKQLVCSDTPALTVNKVKILEELCGTKPCWWGNNHYHR
ncbi:hypothetical protein BXZ70DRAFT_950464 [Cristinia sonorae]|uniref:Uncharacterized protein n=1 Tax=Cristinia sonorae TaxID=1940300 RepID=A0A8K0UIA8_9AGAR|nr:hypothetical protein BXZ70DRAFT_950464 [Cristinia sonorae]